MTHTRSPCVPKRTAWEHALNIDDVDNRPSLQTVLSTAAFCGLSQERAQQTMAQVVCAVDGWGGGARRADIVGADIDMTAIAFSAHAALRTQ